MYKLLRVSLHDMKNIRRDPLLALILFLPLFIALLFRLTFPLLSSWLLNRYHFSLSPAYSFIASLLMLFPPMMSGWVTGFLLLDEKEAELIPTLKVSPLSFRLIGFGRLLWTIPFSFCISVAMIPLSGLLQLCPHHFAAALLASLEAPLMALVLFSLANNRIQGLTIAKGMSVLLAAPAAYFFLSNPWKWLAGIIPFFWPAALAGSIPGQRMIIFSGGLVLHLVLILPFLLKRKTTLTA